MVPRSTWNVQTPFTLSSQCITAQGYFEYLQLSNGQVLLQPPFSPLFHIRRPLLSSDTTLSYPCNRRNEHHRRGSPRHRQKLVPFVSCDANVVPVLVYEICSLHGHDGDNTGSSS